MGTSIFEKCNHPAQQAHSIWVSLWIFYSAPSEGERERMLSFNMELWWLWAPLPIKTETGIFFYHLSSSHPQPQIPLVVKMKCPGTKVRQCIVHSKLLCSVAQLGLTLCSPMDCSPPGYSVHGILQARTGVACHFLLQGIFPTQG